MKNWKHPEASGSMDFHIIDSSALPGCHPVSNGRDPAFARSSVESSRVTRASAAVFL